ncbi:hypothetical protein BT96DRAFT_1004444 [Gymnopus androsaceus JB14]|uniref:Uncharacterized protein n=1 Tax=Gymnopus androsaceus JB14 TaxID=1447944 RepID=A0A6A4GRZ8_9AGAR|nr:hypothetical protein BT96DRAFT_1004444 [Gymnopus androsaceus JB14]
MFSSVASFKTLGTLSSQLTPFESIIKRSVFPVPKVQSTRRVTTVNGSIPITVIDYHMGAIITITMSISVAPHTSAISPMSSTAVSAPSSTSNISESSSSTSSITSSSPQTQHIPPPTFIPISNTNPFPFLPWYPEYAHFVHQWWPTLPNVPQISCTVILLASHNPVTHKTQFVLVQYYFRVPMRNASWIGFGERGKMGRGRRGFVANGTDDLNGGVVNENGCVDGGATAGSRVPLVSWPSTSRGKGPRKGRASNSDPNSDSATGDKDQDHDEAEAEAHVENNALRLWYASDPFEVICLEDQALDDEDGMQERP